MKNSYKAALLAALGLTVASAAQAQDITGTASVNAPYVTGDLLVGIYEPGAANTLILDLGAASSLPTTGGETWNLSSFLSSAGITLDTSAEYGVIGYGTTASHLIYETSASGAPSLIPHSAQQTIEQLYATVGNNAQGAAAVNSGYDWYSQTLNYNYTGGNSILLNSGELLNANAGSADTLYTLTANNSTGSEATDLNFTLGTDGQLTYGSVSSVPEPTTYGMIAAAGLLVISLRNKLSRKQA